MDTSSLFGISPEIAAIAYQLATIVALLICIGGVLRHLLPEPLPDEDLTAGLLGFIRRRWEYDLLFTCLDVCVSWSRWAQVMINPMAHEGFGGFFKALSDTRKQLEKDSQKVADQAAKEEKAVALPKPDVPVALLEKPKPVSTETKK